MPGSAALDVAIGLILVYLVLSLLCSAVNELLEAWMKHRAVDLETGIRRILADADGNGMTKQLYEHPLVSSLFNGQYNPLATRNLPSYIPSRNFALALMDIVLPGAAKVPSGAAGAAAPSAARTPVAPLRDAVAGIQNNEVRRALLTLVDAAGNDMAQARTNIEDWFNSAMDRVSGWYKRRKQQIIFAIGLVVAVGLNVSTITVAKTLWTDQTLRESLVTVAQDYVRTQNQAMASESPSQRLAGNVKQLQSFALPIGWTWEADDQRSVKQADPGIWFERLFGWILTGCAISLGAPFWFDLLGKVSVIRSTMKPQEKSRDS